jgi:uncharacterized protein YndB with AHSA1/START domain
VTDRSVAHGSFTVERTYPAPPRQVYAAWATQAAKDAWFGEGDDFLAVTDQYTLDFRVGGRERLDGTLPSGKAFSYDAVYHDIVDGRRIVASYDVCIDGQRTSVSLMTVEFVSSVDGTRVVLTEQGSFLDGLDSNAQREEGALDSLVKLGRYLDATVIAAR